MMHEMHLFIGLLMMAIRPSRRTAGCDYDDIRAMMPVTGRSAHLDFDISATRDIID